MERKTMIETYIQQKVQKQFRNKGNKSTQKKQKPQKS